MRQFEPPSGDTVGFQDYLRLLPHAPVASSDRMGWVDLQAIRCRATPAFERNLPALTYHRLLLYTRPPEELDLRYEGVKRSVPPPAGSISLMPAGSPAQVRSSGCKDELHIFLEPGLVARVAAEAFELDPARLAVRPLDAALDEVLVWGQPGGHLELPCEMVGAEVGDRRHLLQAWAGIEVLLDVLDDGAEPSPR